MPTEKEGGQYLGGEIMKRAQETNPSDVELTEDEEYAVAQLVTNGNMSPNEAKKIVLQKRKARDEKALNENISPEKAEKEI